MLHFNSEIGGKMYFFNRQEAVGKCTLTPNDNATKPLAASDFFSDQSCFIKNNKANMKALNAKFHHLVS